MSYSSGKSDPNFKLQQSLGNIPFVISGSIVGRYKGRDTDWIVISTIPSLQNLPFYTLTTAQKVKFSSTNSNDNLTGIGARKLLAQYIDSNYNNKEEIIELDGQNEVESTFDVLRVQEMLITDFGSNVDAQTGDSNSLGDIYCGTGVVTDGIPQNKLCVISSTDEDPNSRVGTFTVPDGYIFALNSIHVFGFSDSIGDLRCRILLAARLFGLGQNQWYKTSTYNINQSFKYEPDSLLILPPRTDIQLRIYSDNANFKDVSVYLDFDLKELRV